MCNDWRWFRVYHVDEQQDVDSERAHQIDLSCQRVLARTWHTSSYIPWVPCRTTSSRLEQLEHVE